MSKDGMMPETKERMIHRVVRVDRTQTPQEALTATGRNLYTEDNELINTLPRGESDEVEVIFFQVGRVMTHEDLAQEFALRGLKASDPYSTAKVNEDDPTFAEECPHGTHWEHDGKWCFATFDVWDGEKVVDVSCSGRGWLQSWWFAGIRK